MQRYAFIHSDTPSFGDVAYFVRNDRRLSPERQQSLIKGLVKLLELNAQVSRYDGIAADTTPFTPDVVRGLLRSFGTLIADFDAAEVSQLRATTDFLMKCYGLRKKPSWVPYSDEARGLAEAIGQSYQGRNINRLLRFYSSCNSLIGTPAMMADFMIELNRDASVEHPEKIWQDTVRAWNWAVTTISSWPAIKLTMPRTRKVIGEPWLSFPVHLRAEIEAALQRKPRFVTWDPTVVAAFAREPNGLAHSVELIRINAGALRRAGVMEINTIRDLVVPANFRKMADTLYLEAGRKVTRLVGTKLKTHRSLAVRSGVLADWELQQVAKIMADFDAAHQRYLENHPSRCEVALQFFKDPANMRALRDLPARIFDVTTPDRVTRSFAAEMKQAAMLALRLDTGLPSKLLPRVIYGKHLTELEGDLAGCLRLVVTAAERANGARQEAIVTAAHASIIRRFIRDFRPSLDISGQSPYLFPSIGSEPLTEIAVSSQQVSFLRRHFKNRFRPEVLRAIIKHLIFSKNPEAIGVASAVLGLRDLDYLKDLAQPYLVRRELLEMQDQIVSGKLA